MALISTQRPTVPFRQTLRSWCATLREIHHKAVKGYYRSCGGLYHGTTPDCAANAYWETLIVCGRPPEVAAYIAWRFAVKLVTRPDVRELLDDWLRWRLAQLGETVDEAFFHPPHRSPAYRKKKQAPPRSQGRGEGRRSGASDMALIENDIRGIGECWRQYWESERGREAMEQMRERDEQKERLARTRDLRVPAVYSAKLYFKQLIGWGVPGERAPYIAWQMARKLAPRPEVRRMLNDWLRAQLAELGETIDDSFFHRRHRSRVYRDGKKKKK